MIRDAKARLEALRKLLQDGELSTQEELRAKLEKLDFETTQSTVSRDLKKLGAIKAIDTDGDVVYQLPAEMEAGIPTALPNLIRSIETNGSIIVMRTAVGSASLVARHLDRISPGGILGTIAGDDTIFVAPASTNLRDIKATIREIETAFQTE
jgi:transcriptional regulator of arginine metabolism